MEIEQRYTVAGLIRANATRTPEQAMLVDRGQELDLERASRPGMPRRQRAAVRRGPARRPGGVLGPQRVPLLRDPLRRVSLRDRERGRQLEARAR